MSQGDDDLSYYGSVARFLLESVTRIPAMTCQALLQQVGNPPPPRETHKPPRDHGEAGLGGGDED